MVTVPWQCCVIPLQLLPALLIQHSSIQAEVHGLRQIGEPTERTSEEEAGPSSATTFKHHERIVELHQRHEGELSDVTTPNT